MCKPDDKWEADGQPRELSLVLCDDLEGWDGGSGGGGRLRREGIYVDI